jgi:hypothetical protein
VFKLASQTNGGEVSIVEHPFEVGLLDDIRQRYGLNAPSD